MLVQLVKYPTMVREQDLPIDHIDEVELDLGGKKFRIKHENLMLSIEKLNEENAREPLRSIVVSPVNKQVILVR